MTAPLAQALDAQRHISQFHHTAWTVKEGAPGQITALAQTRDGYLWLATQIGLFRFDGVAFERFDPPNAHAFPAASISALYAPPGGGLWVGFRYGAASFFDGGQLTHYGEAQGLPTSTIFRFAQDQDGTLWAATFTGLVRLRNGRWERLGPSWRVPGRQARTVFVDAAGTLWVATEQGVAFLRRGQTVFEGANAPVGRIAQFAQAPDGGLWVAETDGGVRQLPLDGRAPLTASLASPSAGLLFDRDGVLWASSLGEGVARLVRPTAPVAAASRPATVGPASGKPDITPATVRATTGAGAAGSRLGRTGPAGDPAMTGQPGGDQFDHFRQVDGLSSDYQAPVLEDREGNLWIGSSRGLDRFRHSNVVPAPFPDNAQDLAIAAGGPGVLLAGSRNHPLMHLQGDRQLSFLDLAPPITAAHRDREGVAWLGGPGGLWKLQDGHLEEVTALPVSGYSGVQAIARGKDGGLWVSLNTPGLWHLSGEHWQHLMDPEDMPSGSSPLSLLSAADGRLWMGFARNRLTLMEHDTLTPIGEAQGLQVGNVTALAEGAHGIWIGGERGLARSIDGHIRNVHERAGDPFRGISGIVETAHGELWLNTAHGIVRVLAGQVAHLFDERGAGATFETFDFLDGVPGIPAQFRPIPSIADTGDGRVWFATTSGVVSIDPAALVRNPVPPPVHIRSVLADGRNHSVGAGAVYLPAGVENLQIGYTALSLSIPERVRFRYRLEGHDNQWQDAGTRRTAFYNDPKPGTYTFRVMAANNDGVWNVQGASLQLVIAPRYYQTPWFRVLCVLAGLALLSIAYLLRLRHLARQIRLRVDERHRERERIARELHDTLLQGTQGLILRLHAATQRLPPQDPVRGDLEAAMDLAEHAMAEGRDRVSGLRGDGEYRHDLGAALLHVREEAQSHPLPEMRLIVEGKPRPLLPDVSEELYMLGREAVLNALHHARADTVEIELGFGLRGLRLRIRDDGVGIDEPTPSRPGHWGLDGMYERAERIGASLEILSRPGAGTEVDLRVPARAVYVRPRSVPSWVAIRRVLMPWRR
ncbi:MAG TPA: two-component regulator propeller domain-containing protein [Stenotrophomonas sp.]